MKTEEVMKRLVCIVILMVPMVLVSCAKQGEQKKTAYIAKVGSATITQDDLDKERKKLPEQIQKIFEGPGGTSKFVDELVKKEMLYQEAKKKGLENDSEYLKKVDEFKRFTLMSMLLEKEVVDKAKVTDNDLKAYYDANKAELTTNNQIRASHILVKTEEEAKKIEDQIKKGGDFSKIAKEKSLDPGSGKNGGDLGYFSRGQMVPEFEKVAFSLKAGEVSPPVKTQFGYHIIKVTEKKEGKVVEFDKVKDLLNQRMTAEKQKEVFDSYITTLKKDYKVEINKEELSKIEGEAKGKDSGNTSAKPDTKK
jgi:parvulin-like peptidyl-prolyl isomerase